MDGILSLFDLLLLALLLIIIIMVLLLIIENVLPLVS